MPSIHDTAALFKGRFFTEPEVVAERLHRIRAFVFDWDGVFNGGWKDSEGASPFNEIDSMGTNLLRFNHHLRNSAQPVVAIITGENNGAAVALARRERFHAVYSGIKHKATALDHLNESFGLIDGEVCYMFDDVLDFSIASRCGLRIMATNTCNPLLQRFAADNGYVDYFTANSGAGYAVRVMVELLTGLSGIYDDTIRERAAFTQRYQDYLADRNRTEPGKFTAKDGVIQGA